MKALLIYIILLTAFHIESPKSDASKTPSIQTPAIDWTTTKDWTLYYIKSKKAFSFSLDTLKNFKSIQLDENEMKKFLATAAPLSAERTPYWMG